MPETDTYRELAARLGWDYISTDTGATYLRPIGWQPTGIAHAIIRDRAAEALRTKRYEIIEDCGAFYIREDTLSDIAYDPPESQCVVRFNRLDATDYPTALLAALDLAVIDARKETP